MDTELQECYNEIMQCLIHFGELEESQAASQIKTSSLFEINNELERAYIFHEEPYYWAMELLHAKDNPEWYLDPDLWPPPKDYWKMWEE